MKYIPLCLVLLLLGSHPASAAEGGGGDFYQFEDTMLDEEMKYPEWFKTSFGDLREDLREAKAAGKKGIIVYFGQKRCSYCEKFIKVNLEAPDIHNYLQQHFDVIPVDIWGVDELTTLDGDELTERDYSVFENTNFTPSLIFYNSDGQQVLKLRGLYPPYKFRAAMKYVVEEFYKEETLREYMARADPGMIFDPDGLNEQDFFAQPPYNFDRTRFKAENPLVVFFEQGKCHACDVLHTGPLTDERLRDELRHLEVAQLDMWSEQPVVTPQGKRMTAREWAHDLKLFYAPAMVFFDEAGQEIIRVDAVTQFYRLLGVFGYINKRGFEVEPNYQKWRLSRRQVAM